MWIYRGTNLISQLIEKDFIDRYHMTIIPTILRKEIRLFETTHDYEIKLKLIKSLSYNGISDCFMNEDNILL
ncbi:dihydrofolate reductase family protein [Thomasclavelia ramosa]|uniref:dihydrofolate reductase family protein n=1 Tax=Thomasclavelia ramosa TaxID=1547 RepID=UPI001D08F4DC|nr:dihydrofolate reductase family protein [Thomasclavelia ramosa]